MRKRRQLRAQLVALRALPPPPAATFLLARYETHIYICLCIYACIYLYMYVYMYRNIYFLKFLNNVFTCYDPRAARHTLRTPAVARRRFFANKYTIYIYTYMYACVYMYIYIYICVDR